MQKITLAWYVSRMNVKLLRPADFDSKLREHGVDRMVTVQKLCRICRDKKQVSETSDTV